MAPHQQDHLSARAKRLTRKVVNDVKLVLIDARKLSASRNALFNSLGTPTITIRKDQGLKTARTCTIISLSTA